MIDLMDHLFFMNEVRQHRTDAWRNEKKFQCLNLAADRVHNTSEAGYKAKHS